MTISSTTVRNSYSGDGTTDTFNYTFKIFADTDLQVIIRSSTATETVKTLTTHYTVTGAGNANGGTVVFTAGNIPTATETVVIRRAVPQTQAIDYIANDPFPAESHEEGLDRAMMTLQQVQEEVTRSIKLSRTNTMTSTEFAVGASDRANKILAFDTNGELAVTQELGTFVGNWTTATDFNARDLVKDTTNNNIYLANTSHTSSGSLPISSNADVAKWDLIVDAASATSSATAAAASATAAASSATDAETAQTAAETAQTAAELAESNASTSETNAANSASAASTSATNASNAQTAAETAQAAAESALDTFDDKFLGSKSSDPTLDNDGNALTDGALYFNTTDNVMKVYDLGTTTWLRLTPTSAEQTNINTVAGISSDVSAVAAIDTDVTTVAGIDSDVTTVSGISSDVTTVSGINSAVSTVSTNNANVSTVATNIDNVNAVGTDIDNVNTTATNISGVNSFAERYRVDASDPSTSLDAGDLVFNTGDNQLKYYDGSSWNVVANQDISAKVSANDSTSGFLNGKLVAGSGISFTENNDGSNETLTIASALVYPTITSISPDTITNDATNIVITGTNFVITPNVEIINTSGQITFPNSITRDSATQLTINVTLPTDGTYFIRIENPDGLAVRSSTALLTVSDAPTWTTPAGSLGSIAAGSSVSLSVAGTSDSTVAYSETTAVLTSNTDTPNSTMNLSLNSSTGAITGTAPEPTAETTYNFTLRLTDAESQTTDRAFSITVTTGINNGGQFN